MSVGKDFDDDGLDIAIAGTDRGLVIDIVNGEGGVDLKSILTNDLMGRS